MEDPSSPVRRVGGVRRCALDNGLPSVGSLLRGSVAAMHPWSNLASRQDLDSLRLAAAMRVDPRDIEGRLHPARSASTFVTVSRFFGTDLRTHDLRLGTRRISPAGLGERHHHRALWQVALIPFCGATGEMLVDACVRCGSRLEWSAARPPTHCAVCDRPARFGTIARVGASVLADVAPLTGLIDPRPGVRDAARAQLHPDLRGLDGGAVFDLAWSLGRALTRHPVGLRRLDTALPDDAKVDVLRVGAELLAAWPEALPATLRRMQASDKEAARRLRRALRAMVGERTCRPEQRTVVHLSAAARHRPRDGALRHGAASDGDGARRALRISAALLPRLAAVGSVETVTERPGRYLVADYAEGSLRALAELRDGCLALESVAERLGTTLHGVEQLIRMGRLRESADPAIPVMYVRRQTSRRDYETLVADVVRHASDTLEGDVVPLRAALRSIGGRDKPWGALLAVLADGRLPFALAPASAGVRVRADDVERIVGMASGPRARPGAPYAVEMTRRDAEAVLNLTPRCLGLAVGTELARAALSNGRMDRAAVLGVARSTISPGKVSARFLDGSRRMPAPLRDGTIIRTGPCGWRRRTSSGSSAWMVWAPQCGRGWIRRERFDDGGRRRGKDHERMNFYHYTSHANLPGILADGLNRGEAPISETRVLNAVNPTTDPTPNGHGFDHGGETVSELMSAQLAMHGIRVAAGTRFAEKRAVRITVKLPSSDPALRRWRSWSRKHCAPGWAERLEAAAGPGRKARTWFLYFGTIPPDAFVAVDVLIPVDT